uniref:Uncharacterized protein K02A2.6-like n=1 Tax=Saccoglossus kowalevskii TaxID=10224 RepID=A0ABM0MHH2_SACKO|nr:PREDICTED: uncharacterized protein K02A2.6-like [Saccoglossus kowalevskii]
MSSSFQSRPWERVGMDLFQYKSRVYIIVVDYYSRCVEIKKLSTLTSESVITSLKEMFTEHGIPEIAMSDNGPQFSSEFFSQFAAIYRFVHITSSPRYPRSNGEAERAVQTVKDLLKKNEDPYLALLSYRTTPLQNNLAPSQLLMGRLLRTQLPMLPNTLQARLRNEDLEEVKESEDI